METDMLNRTTRLTTSLIAGVALSFGGVAVAEASHGADDPPGHEAHHHHGQHHQGIEDHHGGHHHGHGAGDGPNHH